MKIPKHHKRVGRAFLCTADHLHPYECDGPGTCVHCDRTLIEESTSTVIANGRWVSVKTKAHDPSTCALCNWDRDEQEAEEEE